MSAGRVLTNALKASAKENSADKLQKTLQWLRKEPRPVLSNVRALSLVYAARNNHFGARHFAKEELPRISYNNQNLAINVDPKKVEDNSEPFSPIMTVTFDGGETKSIDMENKLSATILEELLALDKTK